MLSSQLQLRLIHKLCKHSTLQLWRTPTIVWPRIKLQQSLRLRMSEKCSTHRLLATLCRCYWRWAISNLIIVGNMPLHVVDIDQILGRNFHREAAVCPFFHTGMAQSHAEAAIIHQLPLCALPSAGELACCFIAWLHDVFTALCSQTCNPLVLCTMQLAQKVLKLIAKNLFLCWQMAALPTSALCVYGQPSGPSNDVKQYSSPRYAFTMNISESRGNFCLEFKSESSKQEL